MGNKYISHEWLIYIVTHDNYEININCQQELRPEDHLEYNERLIEIRNYKLWLRVINRVRAKSR